MTTTQISVTAPVKVAVVYKTITGRFAFRSFRQSAGHWQTSNGQWASAAYAAKVAKQSGFTVIKEAGR